MRSSAGALIPLVTLSIVSGCGTPITREAARSLVISEVHFSPSAAQGGSAAAFIEVFNVTDWPQDVSGWSLTYTAAPSGSLSFPAGTTIPPNSALVFFRDKTLCERNLRCSADLALPLPVDLDRERGTVRLLDPNGRTEDEVSYSTDVPEVRRALGTGLSLHRMNFRASGGAKAWNVSEPTPGIEEEIVLPEAGTQL